MRDEKEERKKQARSHVHVCAHIIIHLLYLLWNSRDKNRNAILRYQRTLRSLYRLYQFFKSSHIPRDAFMKVSTATSTTLQSCMYMYCVALPRCLFDLACFFLPSFFISLTCTCFNPPSQFSRLGIQVSLAIICLFVWAMVGWVALPFFSFLFFFKLVCYVHVFPCRSTTQ